MNKTNEKAKTISEVIDELNKWKEELGDVEVFIANSDEATFDSIGKTFAIKVVEGDFSAVGIIRGDVALKP